MLQVVKFSDYEKQTQSDILCFVMMEWKNLTQNTKQLIKREIKTTHFVLQLLVIYVEIKEE